MFEPVGSVQYKTMLNWFGTLYRSSCSQAFHKKGAANSFKKKITEKYLCYCLFFNNLAILQ